MRKLTAKSDAPDGCGTWKLRPGAASPKSSAWLSGPGGAVPRYLPTSLFNKLSAGLETRGWKG